MIESFIFWSGNICGVYAHTCTHTCSAHTVLSYLRTYYSSKLAFDLLLFVWIGFANLLSCFLASIVDDAENSAVILSYKEHTVFSC